MKSFIYYVLLFRFTLKADIDDIQNLKMSTGWLAGRGIRSSIYSVCSLWIIKKILEPSDW